MTRDSSYFNATPIALKTRLVELIEKEEIVRRYARSEQIPLLSFTKLVELVLRNKLCSFPLVGEFVVFQLACSR